MRNSKFEIDFVIPSGTADNRRRRVKRVDPGDSPRRTPTIATRIVPFSEPFANSGFGKGEKSAECRVQS